MEENLKVETNKVTKKKITILRNFSMENTCVLHCVQFCRLYC
jgi:hypothetical protein